MVQSVIFMTVLSTGNTVLLEGSSVELPIQQNVSFSMNTDGIAINQSVSTGVWPVYLAVNELPIHAR